MTTLSKNKSSAIQPELIFNTYWGFAGSQALAVAVELDVFSAIYARHNTLDKLSRQLKIPLRSLKIFLDALVGLGFLNKTRNSYALTPETRTYLVKGEPHYLGGILSRTNRNFETWVHLKDVVVSGCSLHSGKEDSLRSQFFIQLARDLFSTSYSSAVLVAKKMGVGKTVAGLKILDLACGSGAWSIACALADKKSQVTAVDLPSVMDLTRQYVKRFRLDSQYEYRPADLRQLEISKEKYDLIILGHICHGLGENDSRKLIKKCYEGLNKKGRLLIAEIIPNDLKTADPVALLFGLEMLLNTPSGDVFTVKELKRWLLLSGFKKAGTFKAQYPTTVIVGEK